MSDSPKISVLMAAYNAEPFLREAIDSVLNQSFQDFEFLIFEDCSQDATLEIIQSYDDPRLRVIINETNQGLTKCLIYGMELAKGEYVARMDADDVCMTNRFERQLAYFSTHPEVSVLGSAVTFFDGKGYEFVGYQPETHDEIKVALFLGFTMLHPSVMMRKADMDKFGLNYNPEFVVSQDHDLWTRAVRKLRFANFGEPLLNMREHSSKIGSTRKPEQVTLSNRSRKYQLDELGVFYSPEEFYAFNMAAGMPEQFDETSLLNLESIFLKVIQANRDIGIYVQSILEKAVAARFRSICRNLLLGGTATGSVYWKSQLRSYDAPTLREKIGLLYRSILCLHKKIISFIKRKWLRCRSFVSVSGCKGDVPCIV